MDSFTTIPTTELILTNKNIVLITRIKKIFAQEQLSVEVFPLVDVKVYDGMPQIKHNNSDRFPFIEQFTYSNLAAPDTRCGFAVILCTGACELIRYTAIQFE